MEGSIAETTFYEDPKNPSPDTDQGGVNVHEHAKELCVNKLGQTMVVPPKEGTSRVKFGELFRKYRLRTIGYCSVFWSFGMCATFSWPTLLDLECRLESTLLSLLFSYQPLFTFIGAACGGYLAPKFVHSILLLVSSIIICVTLAIIPFCNYLRFSVAFAFMNFFMGIIDTVANIAMIELYRRNFAPFLQALHFSYGLGAFVSPLIAKPFLLNKQCSALIVAAALPDVVTLQNFHFVRKVNLTDIFQEISDAQKNSNIEYAFWILAAMQIPVIIILSVLVAEDFFGWNNRYEFNTPGFVETKEGIEMNRASISRKSIPVDASEDRLIVSKHQLKLLVGSTVAILYIYDGLQACFGYYLYLYLVISSFSGINFHDEMSSLNSCFWGLFAFGRLLSIGISTKLTPALMLIINMIGCLCSIILLLFFLQSRLVIYIGTSLFAMFLSSVYPTSVTLAQTYINVTSSIASILVVGAAFGEIMVPHILDIGFDGMKPEYFLMSSLIMILLSCVFYIVVVVVGDSILRQSWEKSVMQIMKFLLCPPNEKEKVTEDSGQRHQIQT
ncbi:UNVERIFIED_CONTAM: hypothetical protein RMT77_008548 [Armadillidium vulgare]